MVSSLVLGCQEFRMKGRNECMGIIEKIGVSGWTHRHQDSLEQCLLGEIIDLGQWRVCDSSPLQCSLTSQSQIGVQEMNTSLWTYQFYGWGCIRLPLICDLGLWFKSCGYSPLIGHTTSAQFYHISILPECLFFSLSALTSFCNPNRLFPQEANFLPRRLVYEGSSLQTSLSLPLSPPDFKG